MEIEILIAVGFYLKLKFKVALYNVCLLQMMGGKPLSN